MKKILALFLFGGIAVGCNQVGSESWCEDLEDKPQGEWSIKDGENYVKHCLGLE